MKKRPAFNAASVTPACTPNRRRLSKLLVLSLLLSLPGMAWGQEEATTPEWDRRLVFSEDVIAAAKLQGSDQIIGVGEFGMLALIDFNEKEISKAELVETEITEDLNDVVAMPDGSAVIGSASGNILRYADGSLEVVQNVGNDSVLDLGVQRDSDGSIVAIWAAGGRGILAVSRDGAKTWEDAAPQEVSQPALPLPNNQPGIWFTGVANVIEESVVLNANVKGRPAELGKDYKMTYEDGILEVVNELDASPQPTLEFKFRPGAAFQAGDFTLSTLYFQGDLITAAGEFGLVLQSSDGGATWVRRNAALSPRDPDTPYWIASTGRDDTILLVGAAGAVQQSNDRGVTWTAWPQPAGTAGVFGAYLPRGASPLIVGAVGLLGEGDGGDWRLVDRSALQLYSWLKTILVLEDNTLLSLGGRGSCVFRKGTANWERCRIRLNDDNA